ncbi:MAG TPA: ABC transporter, partial [Opitutae bacterium]|nr:ABC transporter [Opitutae bacterium]
MFWKTEKTLGFPRSLGIVTASIAFSTNLQAKQIDWNEAESFFERTSRFWQMQDQSVQIVVLGSILIGISCGLIGSYVVTRRLSLFGDTL